MTYLGLWRNRNSGFILNLPDILDPISNGNINLVAKAQIKKKLI